MHYVVNVVKAKTDLYVSVKNRDLRNQVTWSKYRLLSRLLTFMIPSLLFSKQLVQFILKVVY